MQCRGARRRGIGAAQAVIVLALGLSSASAAAAGPAPRTVTVVTSEYRFSPDALVLQRGVAYRLHLENRGKDMHEFHAPEFFKSAVVENPSVLNADKTEVVLKPGATKDLYVVPRRAGRYPLYCPDHDWAGMTGEITVK